MNPVMSLSISSSNIIPNSVDVINQSSSSLLKNNKIFENEKNNFCNNSSRLQDSNDSLLSSSFEHLPFSIKVPNFISLSKKEKKKRIFKLF
jgi:hypothetical protein